MFKGFVELKYEQFDPYSFGRRVSFRGKLNGGFMHI